MHTNTTPQTPPTTLGTKEVRAERIKDITGRRKGANVRKVDFGSAHDIESMRGLHLADSKERR